MFQLPSAVTADAIAVLCYSFFCLFVNILLVWLTWSRKDRTSYVACISYATLIVTMTSIAQQFYDYAYWVDLISEQFYYTLDNPDDAEIQYQKGAQGVKLVLSYVRIFGFTIESTYAFFFALQLAASVYGWFTRSPKTKQGVSITGRVLPLILTCITVVLMHFPPGKGSLIIYIIIANAQVVLSLLGTAILLLMILYKYIQSHRRLNSYGVASAHSGNLAASKSGHRRGRSLGGNRATSNETYESWLVIRLSIAFLVLCVFEYTTLAPRLKSAIHIVSNASDAVPDLSVKRALASVRGYLSGVTPSIVAFLVFGTTKDFRRKIVKAFIPKRLQWKKKPKRNIYVPSLHGKSELPTPLPRARRTVHQVDEFSLIDLMTVQTDVNTGTYSPKYGSDESLGRRASHGMHTDSTSTSSPSQYAFLSSHPIPSPTTPSSTTASPTTASPMIPAMPSPTRHPPLGLYSPRPNQKFPREVYRSPSTQHLNEET